ncbi:MAG: cytochrome c [Rhodopseudomonas palustris]|uniref:Cytochrome c n=1 Tax=Rhodopseudomonas palustris TaxID=1076 RepID=A0A933VZY5_RHOPL|nr:cytochrome c [Rhodopseudomonas palustris]
MPNDLASRASKGARDFDEMCTTCHGAPGKERSEIGVGLNPQPPKLEDVGPTWSPSEMFLIVNNGIRMTGMPVFGPTHDDERLWSIKAFAGGLLRMDPDAYAKTLEAAEPDDASDQYPHHYEGAHSHGSGYHHQDK